MVRVFGSCINASLSIGVQKTPLPPWAPHLRASGTAPISAWFSSAPPPCACPEVHSEQVVGVRFHWRKRPRGQKSLSEPGPSILVLPDVRERDPLGEEYKVKTQAPGELWEAGECQHLGFSVHTNIFTFSSDLSYIESRGRAGSGPVQAWPVSSGLWETWAP